MTSPMAAPRFSAVGSVPSRMITVQSRAAAIGDGLDGAAGVGRRVIFDNGTFVPAGLGRSRRHQLFGRHRRAIDLPGGGCGGAGVLGGGDVNDDQLRVGFWRLDDGLRPLGSRIPRLGDGVGGASTGPGRGVLGHGSGDGGRGEQQGRMETPNFNRMSRCSSPADGVRLAGQVGLSSVCGKGGLWPPEALPPHPLHRHHGRSHCAAPR